MKDFSSLAAPLTEAIQKNTSFKGGGGGEENKKMLSLIKENLTNAYLLALLNLLKLLKLR